MVAPLIAIVEDDEAILDVITECLTTEGYRTLSYRKGAGPYEFIEHEWPAAVVLDIRMEQPRAGMAVLQGLHHDPATATTPILICTADVSFTRERARTLAEHRCAVLTKPFLIDDLLAAVACLLDPPAPIAGDWRAKDPVEQVIQPVVGLVDADGKGVTAHSAPLEHKGYKVVACRWGDGIFDMAVCEQPEMLLVDPGDRPRGAVSYALRRLGRDPLTGHIPIVVNPPRDGEVYRLVEDVVGPAPGAPRPAPHRRA